MAVRLANFSTSMVRIATVALALTMPALASSAEVGEFDRLRTQSAQAEDKGDISQAIRLSLKMLNLRQGDLPTMVTLSGLYGVVKQPELQLHWSQKILQLDPNHFDALINQGNALAALGNVQNAKDSFIKAKYVQPKNPVAPYSLGVLAQSQGKDEEAAGLFQTSLKIFPGFEAALFNLAVSHANLGKRSEALQALDRLLKNNPGAADALELKSTLTKPLNSK